MERARRIVTQTNAHCMDMLAEVQPYLVEVAYFFFFLSRHMTLPLFQEYVQSEFYKQSHLKASVIESFDVYSGNGSGLYNVAHRESTLAILSLQIAEGLPAVITVIILGAVSDKTSKRKILLWMPSLGGILHSLIYILILYTSWTMDGLFMASAIRGLSGSMTAFLAGSTFFAINTTQREKRFIPSCYSRISEWLSLRNSQYNGRVLGQSQWFSSAILVHINMWLHCFPHFFLSCKGGESRNQ